MMLRSRSLHPRLRPTLVAALVGLLTAAAAAHAQTRWVVDPKTSFAWWQMSPNLNHLWSTTCPGDPSWRPGEGRSSGWAINPKLKLPKTGYANVEDTIHMPLYPRTEVLPDCAEAVKGEVVVGDMEHGRGVHGVVSVQGDALITGEAMRDVLMHQVMQTVQYPEITFKLDSLVGATKQADTLVARAAGILTIRGVAKPTLIAVKAFPDAGGMRVLAHWHVPATDLLELTPKLHSFGLGVNVRLWKDFFMGCDILFHREGGAAN